MTTETNEGLKKILPFDEDTYQIKWTVALADIRRGIQIAFHKQDQTYRLLDVDGQHIMPVTEMQARRIVNALIE